MSTDLLKVQGLKQYFDVSPSWVQRKIRGLEEETLKAVDDVDFSVKKGSTMALVGESGCGKSTIAKLVVGLQTPTEGDICFDGMSYAELNNRLKMAPIHRRVTMIFQDPFASLNPRWKVARVIAEPLHTFKLAESNSDIQKRVDELLIQVGLSPVDGKKYPHEFSGGQRQRISIARALACSPDFIVCDEPTSALDVSVQAQILNLMKQLQSDLGLTYLFISHDLAVVKHMADRIGVMYLGRLCEQAPSKQLFRSPQHPYTRMLLDTIPNFDFDTRDRQPVQGEVPNPIHPPSGCTFHPRCPFAEARCQTERPQIRKIGDAEVACHLAEQLNA